MYICCSEASVSLLLSFFICSKLMLQVSWKGCTLIGWVRNNVPAHSFRVDSRWALYYNIKLWWSCDIIYQAPHCQLFFMSSWEPGNEASLQCIRPGFESTPEQIKRSIFSEFPFPVKINFENCWLSTIQACAWSNWPKGLMHVYIHTYIYHKLPSTSPVSVASLALLAPPRW